MGVGAYAAAVLETKVGTPFCVQPCPSLEDLSPCWSVSVLGIPSLRVKGLYLALDDHRRIVHSRISSSANWKFTGGTGGLSVAAGAACSAWHWIPAFRICTG
jgi:branched-chain amino acid transport system permease protein